MAAWCIQAGRSMVILTPGRARPGRMKSKDSSFVVRAALSSAIGYAPRGPRSQKYEALKPWQKARINLSVFFFFAIPQCIQNLSFQRKFFQIFWLGSRFEHLFSDPFGSGGRREAGGVKPQSDTVGFDHGSQCKLQTTAALSCCAVQQPAAACFTLLLYVFFSSCLKRFLFILLFL